MPVLASQWLDPFHTFHMDDTQVIHASFSPNTPVQLTVSYVDLTMQARGPVGGAGVDRDRHCRARGRPHGPAAALVTLPG